MGASVTGAGAAGAQQAPQEQGGGFGSRAGGTSLDDLLDVVAGDAATQPRAGDLGRIETVVGDQSPDDR